MAVGSPVIQRKTLVFGHRTNDGVLSGISIPEIAARGPFYPDSLFEKDTNYDSVIAQYYDPNDEGLSYVAYARMDIAQGSGLAPVRAIGIAADSVFQSCDVSIMGRKGEMDRHRISPGNPLIGGLDDADHALIALPNAPPIFISDDAEIFFGGMPFSAGSGELPNQVGVGWPLRLELFRGDLMPMRTHLRAPMFGHGIVRFASGTDNRDVIACVDGRRRIDLTVLAQGTTVTLTAFQIHNMIKVPPSALLGDPISEALTINGNPTEALADGVPETFSFEGNSMTFVKFTLDPAGAGYAQVKIVARDDF